MIIGWVGSASVGIFMARYMKVAFGKKELLGTKVWFTVRYDVTQLNLSKRRYEYFFECHLYCRSFFKLKIWSC